MFFVEKNQIKKVVLCFVFTVAPLLSFGASNSLIYLNEESLEAVQAEISQYHYFFYNAYLDLIDAATAEISKAVNPVTNKTQMPPSGDKHDYLSLAPYWWPNPDTDDGLPWIRKDGQVNPETRGDHTDQVRSSAMFESVETLALAYYFSKEERYAQKAYQHIYAWFIDEETKMNPNINYGQAVPGSVEGRAAGIIELVGIGKLITALQILERDSIMPQNEVAMMKQWMTDMLTWLTTHEYALKENESEGNHSNWYDYQVLGMYLYLGDTIKATTKAENVKTKRIAVQIQPDGSQPEELGRTKSVNYTTMNLWAMTNLCILADKVGVDLWSYQTSDGRSIRRAYEFLLPYTMKKKTWTWEQIKGGGAVASIEEKFPPLLAKASGIFQETLMPTEKIGSYGLSYIEKLCYPPLDMLKVKQSTDLIVAFANPSKDTVLTYGAAPNTYSFDLEWSEASLDEVSLWMCIDGISLKTDAGRRQVWKGGDDIVHNDLAAISKGIHELKVVAKTVDGSLSESFINVTVEEASSLTMNTMKELYLYPNPTQGIVFLNENNQWTVYSLTGKIIGSAYGRSIDLSDVEDGIYLVKTPNAFEKVIKQ